MMQESVTAYANSVGWIHIYIIRFSYDLHSKTWYTVPRFFFDLFQRHWGTRKPDMQTGDNMRNKMKKKRFVVFLVTMLMLLKVSTSAQELRNVILPKSIYLSTDSEYEIGDTIIFKSIASSRNEILPIVNKDYYGEWQNNVKNYKEGIFSCPPRKVRNKNYFVYHSDYPWGKVYKGTPVSDIIEKKLVLLEKREVDFYDYEYLFLNTYYNDTLLLRRRSSSLSKLENISDIAFVPRLDRVNTLRYAGQTYYQEIKDTSSIREGDRTIRSGLNFYHVFRPYTLVKIEYEFSIISGNSHSRHIWLKDNLGEITEEGLLYTKEALDQFEQESLDYLKSKRYPVVKLENVEKNKNQNIRDGELKDNEVYEDNLISIQWEEKDQTFYFVLKNKTNDIIKIIWDEALIINFDNYTERVLHKGTDIEALKQSQQPSLIPSAAQLSDYFRPENKYNVSKTVDGDIMKLVMPIQFGSNTMYYTFVFRVSWKYQYPELQLD